MMNDEDLALQSRIDVIREIGFMGYKFLITLSSGAFVVLLTFVGNVGSDAAYILDLERLRTALFFFLGAIVLTFVSMAIAYLSAQLSLAEHSLPGGKSFMGHILWLLMPVILAFLAFCIGAIFAIFGISPA